MDLFVGNLTAGIVILGNPLKTAIQPLHISNSQIHTCCLGKAPAEIQLNSLNCRDLELTWVEPTDALADAASREGDAGAPLDAKQLWKIAETGNRFFFNQIVLLCISYFTCLSVCMCVCVCSSIGADTGNQNFFIYGLGGWVNGSSEILMFTD